MKKSAAALACQLFVTNCLLAHAAESAAYGDRSARAAKASLLASLPSALPFISSPRSAPASPSRVAADPAFASLDASLGTVRSILARPASGRSVVYIHDVHGNEEAQRRIAGAVTALIDGGKADVLVLEGASGTIDIRPFRNSPWPESSRRAADGLLADGKISGAVLGAALSRRSVPVVGAENPSLYERNVDAVRRAKAALPAVRRVLADRRGRLEAEKARVFSTRLREFDRIVEGYRSGTVPIGRYADAIVAGRDSVSTNVELFLEASHLESRIDMRAAESQRTQLLSRLAPRLSEADARDLIESGLSYRAGRIRVSDFYRRLSAVCSRSGVALQHYPSMNRFVQYVLLADAINMDRLAVEFARLEEERYARLAATPAEKRVAGEAATLRLQEGIAEFALTAEEWNRYRATAGREPMLAAFEDFYASADARNAAIAGKLSAAMRDHGPRAILVTGGFHARSVMREIGDSASVATFVPRMTVADLVRTSQALSVFTQEKTPLDQLFAGDRLFLAPAPAPLAARTAASINTAADAFKNGAPEDVAEGVALARTGIETDFEPVTADGVPTTLTRDGAGVRTTIPFDDQGRPREPEGSEPVEANVLRSITFNSNAMAVPLTLLAVGAFWMAGIPLFEWYHLAGILYINKSVLTLSVLWHERGHLSADGQLRGKTALEQERIIYQSLLHLDDIESKSIWEIYKIFSRRFLLGTEISNAYVEPQSKRKAIVKQVAAAGRKVNEKLLIWGAATLITATIFSGTPMVATYVAILGFTIMTANFALLVLNRWSTDVEAERTGVAPKRYRAGPADAGDGRAADKPLFSMSLSIDQTTKLSQLQRDAVMPMQEEIAAELSARGLPLPDGFEDALGPSLVQIFQRTLSNGAARMQLTANLEDEAFSLTIQFLDGGVSSDQMEEIESWATRDNWRISWTEKTASNPQTLVLRSPMNIPLTIEDLPVDGPDLAAYLRRLSPERARQAKDLVVGMLRPARNRPTIYFSEERLLGMLWMNDEEIYDRAILRLSISGRAAEMERLANELKDVSARASEEVERRRAQWSLNFLQGLNTDAPVAKRWKFERLNGLDFPNNRRVRVSLAKTGVVDLIIEEPVGLAGRVLKRIGSLLPFLSYPATTVTTIRMSFPGLAAPLEGPLDADWLNVVQVSFPGEKPSAAMFSLVMQAFGELAAPMGTAITLAPGAAASVTDTPVDWRWESSLRDVGFRSGALRLGLSADLVIQKTEQPTKKNFAGRPYNSANTDTISAFMLVRGLLFFWWFHMDWRDEVYHMVVARFVENAWVERYEPLWKVHLGLTGKSGATYIMRTQTDDWYRKHPLRLAAATGAPFFGFLSTLVVFGSLLGLRAAGAVDLPLWLTAWAVYEVVIGGWMVTLNLIQVPVGDFEGSDFYRYWNERRQSPSRKAPPRKRAVKDLDDWYDDAVTKKKRPYSSPQLDLGIFFAAVVKAASDGIRARRLARRGVTDLVDSMRRELRNGGALSEATSAAIRFRSNHLYSRFLRRLPLQQTEALHEIDWSLLSREALDPTNPLIGAKFPDVERLRSYFIDDDAWRAYEAYRERDASDRDFGPSLRRPNPLRLQLTLAAIRPDRINAFFAEVAGKPEAAEMAVRLANERGAGAVVILDELAVPWEAEVGRERFGSIAEEITDLDRRRRLGRTQRLFAPYARILVAMALVNRTRGTAALSASEREAFLVAILNALEPAVALPANYDPAREEKARVLRNVIIQEVAAMAGYNSSSWNTPDAQPGRSAPQSDRTNPSDPAQTDGAPETIPAGPGAGPGRPAAGQRGYPYLPARPVSSTNADATRGIDGSVDAADPLDLMLQELRARSGNTGRSAVPLREAAPAGERDVVPSANEFPATRPPAAPAVPRQPVVNADRTNAGRPPSAPPAVTDSRTDTQPDAAAVAAAARRAANDASAENAAAAAGSARAVFAAQPAAVRPGADPVSRPAEIAAANAAVGRAPTAVENAASAARDVVAMAADPADQGNPAGISPAAGAPVVTTEAGDRAAAGFRAARNGPFTSDFATARGYDTLALIAVMSVAASLIAIGIQQLGLPQLWLPGIVFVVGSASVALMSTYVGAAGTAFAGASVAVVPAPAFGFARIQAATSDRAGSSDGRSPEPARNLQIAARALVAAVSSISRIVTSALAAANPYSSSSRARALLEQRAVRAAAIGALDESIALIASQRAVSVTDAALAIANDQLTEEERAVVEELARATREAARNALALSVRARGASQRVRRAEQAAAEPDAAEIRPVVFEIRNIALVWVERQRPAPRVPFIEDRQKLQADSVRRGRALKVLGEVFAKEMMETEDKSARRGAVRTLQIQSGAFPTKQRPAVAPATRRPTVSKGALKNPDLEGIRTEGRRKGALFLANGDDLAAGDILARTDSETASLSERRLVAAFGSAAENGAALAAGLPVRSPVATDPSDGSEPRPDDGRPESGEAVTSAADAPGGIATESPVPDFLESLVQDLDVPATLAATVAVVGLAVAAVAFGGVQVIAAVLTVMVMGLIALSARITRAQREIAEDAAAAEGTDAQPDGPEPQRGAVDEAALSRFADLVVDFAAGYTKFNTAEAGRRLAELLPPVDSLGVADPTIMAAVAGMNEADFARLATMLRERLSARGISGEINEMDARIWLSGLLASSGGKESLAAAAYDKNLFYPVRERATTEEQDQETDGIKRLLPLLGEGRVLYLGVVAGSELERRMREEFGDDKRIVLLSQEVGVFETRDGRPVLSLAALAAGLASSLNDDQMKNLIVLIPDMVGWDDAGLGERSILDDVGILLLRDFVTGIPVDRALLRNIGRIAEIISTQA